MPFTPFHFGPGLLVKSVVPRAFSFVAFACTQVVIDVETLYNLWNHNWPVHRFLHSIPGGIIAGLAVAAVLGAVARRVLPLQSLGGLASGEFRRAGLLLGGVLGGASHSVLDAIMHDDVRLLYPFGAQSALYGLLTAHDLQAGCVITAVAGIGVLLLRYDRRRFAGSTD